MSTESPTPEAPRDVCVMLSRKNAETLRHRCYREVHLLRARGRKEDRPLTSSEKGNVRRHLRVAEHIEHALRLAGYEPRPERIP